MATDKTPSSKHGRLHEEEARRAKADDGFRPAPSFTPFEGNVPEHVYKPAAKPDPFPETPAAITLDDIAAEFGPEATIRGNTNLGIYEIVTPTAVHAIDRDKAAKLSSKAELRAYVDELKAK